MKNLITLCFVFLSIAAFSESNEDLHFYLDADFYRNSESSTSIKRGFELALDEVDFKIQDRKIVIIDKDHRGNTRRSKRNIETFLKDPKGVLMISGIHSPPLITLKNFINDNKVLYLVPWAAGAPITRSETKENWIFRLSLDDSKVGGFLAEYAARKLKAKKPCLLLENTGWGKGNLRNISSGLKKFNIKVNKTFWFDWGVRKNQASEILKNAQLNKCDLFFLVANAPEAIVLVQENSSLVNPIPILSHWGVMVGDFQEKIPYNIREKSKLRFVHSKFNFNTSKETDLTKKVLTKIISNYPDIKNSSDIKAMPGYVHGYDLGKIVITALKSISLKGKTQKEIKDQLKAKLENLNSSVKGLIKGYKKPFSKYSKKRKDAHEALDARDFSIAKFGKNNEVLNVSASGK